MFGLTIISPAEMYHVEAGAYVNIAILNLNIWNVFSSTGIFDNLTLFDIMIRPTGYNEMTPVMIFFILQKVDGFTVEYYCNLLPIGIGYKPD